MVYDCATIPTATPPNCIAVGTTAISVNACPAGNFCNYAAAGFLQNPNLTPQACTAITPPPNPIPPVTNIMPGDTCNAANKDTCNKGTCTGGICVSSTATAAACGISGDCPLGNYCDPTAKTCMAIVAPQGTCTPGPSITTTVDQCGYHAYCINSKCTLPFSLPAGNTMIPQATAGVNQGFVSRLCTSGYATVDATTTNYFCAPAPTNTLTKGQATAAQCAVTVTDSKGATTT